MFFIPFTIERKKIAIRLASGIIARSEIVHSISPLPTLKHIQISLTKIYFRIVFKLPRHVLGL
jgi:hypothetical protein